MLIDGKTKYALLDNFNIIEEKLTGKEICKTLSSLKNVDGLRMRNITKTECENVFDGILTNGGLTETLFHFLRGVQEVLLQFEDRRARSGNESDIKITK